MSEKLTLIDPRDPKEVFQFGTEDVQEIFCWLPVRPELDLQWDVFVTLDIPINPDSPSHPITQTKLPAQLKDYALALKLAGCGGVVLYNNTVPEVNARWDVGLYVNKGGVQVFNRILGLLNSLDGLSLERRGNDKGAEPIKTILYPTSSDNFALDIPENAAGYTVTTYNSRSSFTSNCVIRCLVHTYILPNFLNKN